MKRYDQRLLRRNGFTLIELLIVLGIIGVLTAIGMYVYNTVRVHAGKSTCTSNLHQLYQAISLYAGDNNGIIPPYTTEYLVTSNAHPMLKVDRSADLISSLYPYTKSKEIWFCPADPYAQTDKQFPPVAGQVLNHKNTSYVTNGFWWGPYSAAKRFTNPVLGITPLDFSYKDAEGHIDLNASNTGMLGDELGVCGGGGYSLPLYSHNGQNIQVFFDGHVKTYVCGANE